MDEDRSQNPRPLPSGVIVERFRSTVQENDEEDVVRVYEELLSDLTFNSKPIITELTIIAGDQREHAEAIADAICTRILEEIEQIKDDKEITMLGRASIAIHVVTINYFQVPVDQKLPSLYLLDSIVKNIGHEYVKHFAARLPKVFCEAYNQVHPNMHPSMRHLFGTWSQVFPSSVLHKIEEELQFSTTESQRSAGLVNVRNSESPSPRPSHGIHVNPKYLEARRQFQHSSAVGAIGTQKTVHTADFEEDGMERITSENPKGWSGASPKFNGTGHSSGNSSRMHVNGHNSSIHYGAYDFAYREAVPPHLGRSKVASGTKVEGPIRQLNVMVRKPLSPSRARLRRSASPVDERFTGDGSPRRATERASAAYPRLGFGPGILVNHNGWLERSFPSDVGCPPQLDASTAYDPSIAYSKKHPRELIDAYGNYKEQDTSFEKLPKLQRIEVNGVNREAATRNWRSFEEEEYVWEDMSPTLASRSGRNNLPPLGPSSGVLSRRVGLSRPDVGILEPDYRVNNWFGQTKLHPFDDSARIVDDRIPVLGSGHASMHMRSSDGRGGQYEQAGNSHSSHHVQEPGKFPYNFQHPSRELNSRSRGWSPQLPLTVSGTTAVNGPKLPGFSDNSPDVELPFQRLSSIHSDSSNVETSVLEKQLALRPFSPPAAPVIWPPIHKSQPLPLHPIPPNPNPLKGVNPIESSKPVHQGPNPPMFLPHQQFEPADRETSISNKLPPLPPQQSGLMHSNQQIHEQNVHQSYIPSVSGQLSSHLLAQPHNVQMHGQGVTMGSLRNSLSGMASSMALHSSANTSLRVHGGIMPPLPAGPPPGTSHIVPASQNTGSVVSGPPVSAFSGLISNLMAQGLILLTPPTRSEDSLGLDFNAEILKVRHESAINALYANLPRQCTTCGLRFKFQEEHSSHMDWHVTKNRISKNRKQKPSRKWFVNTKEWLSGAETVGTDVVPFLPTEVVLEKKEDKEMAVPADENQTLCALCGEPFEDFYSDEAEEWMYKGAVYMNAPDGHSEGLDRSQLGPIVHAKCRSNSNEGS